MGLDDLLKQQIRDRTPELKPKLVNEFDELTQKDMDETGDDPDKIVDRVQQKIDKIPPALSLLRQRDVGAALRRRQRQRSLSGPVGALSTPHSSLH
jgi:hypothetical protein